MSGDFMNLPKKISPCPIIETVFEVRFESELPGDAIFGIMYSVLKDDFPKLDKLPILQIPEAIRSSDPNLIYAPHYKLSGGNFVIQIGSKVFSFSNVNEYVGWELFHKEVNIVLKKICGLNIIKEANRIGLRYINLFPEMNIFEKSDLKINLKEEPLEKDVNLVISMPVDGFTNTLRMVSNTKIDISGRILNGSIIDIDTVLNGSKSNFFIDVEKILSDAHLEEKKLFFSLLKDEYIKTLNPE